MKITCKEKARRTLIILIWGYCGDVVEALGSALKALLDVEYSKEMLGC